MQLLLQLLLRLLCLLLDVEESRVHQYLWDIPSCSDASSIRLLRSRVDIMAHRGVQRAQMNAAMSLKPHHSKIYSQDVQLGFVLVRHLSLKEQ